MIDFFNYKRLLDTYILNEEVKYSFVYFIITKMDIIKKNYEKDKLSVHKMEQKIVKTCFINLKAKNEIMNLNRKFQSGRFGQLLSEVMK